MGKGAMRERFHLQVLLFQVHFLEGNKTNTNKRAGEGQQREKMRGFGSAANDLSAEMGLVQPWLRTAVLVSVVRAVHQLLLTEHPSPTWDVGGCVKPQFALEL